MRLTKIEMLIIVTIGVIVTFLSCKVASGQTAAQLQKQITALGARVSAAEGAIKTIQAATQPSSTLPAWPPDVHYASDFDVYFSGTGNDLTGIGSAASPLQTWNAALNHVKGALSGPAPPKAPCIHVDASSFTDATPCDVWSNWFTVPGLIVDGSWKAAGIEQRAVIRSNDVAFGIGSQTHLQNLRVIADPAGSFAGLYCSRGDDISADYCEFVGFKTFNVAIIGRATHARLWHCFIAGAFDPSTSTAACSGLYTEAKGPDVQACIFYHNGWKGPIATTDDAWVSAIKFRHGWYENPSTGATSGTDQFNFYLRNAATGHQGRAGGLHSLYNVFWDNGNAADVFAGPGIAGLLGGEIGYCAFFGNLANDFPAWGGGVVGQSVADEIHHCIFSSPLTSMGIQPAVAIAWNAYDNNVQPPLILPVTATASVHDNRGIWPNGGIVASNGRAITSQANNSLRLPRAGEHTPTLMDWRGVQTEAQLIEDLRTHLHDPSRSAQAAHDWLSRQSMN
jgi:hypothetical protein